MSSLVKSSRRVKSVKSSVEWSCRVGHRVVSFSCQVSQVSSSHVMPVCHKSVVSSRSGQSGRVKVGRVWSRSGHLGPASGLVGPCQVDDDRRVRSIKSVGSKSCHRTQSMSALLKSGRVRSWSTLPGPVKSSSGSSRRACRSPGRVVSCQVKSTNQLQSTHRRT